MVFSSVEMRKRCHQGCDKFDADIKTACDKVILVMIVISNKFLMERFDRCRSQVCLAMNDEGVDLRGHSVGQEIAKFEEAKIKSWCRKYLKKSIIEADSTQREMYMA